jgi:hypothetical protein
MPEGQKPSDLVPRIQKMSKEQRSNKETKKKPALTAKEKKVAKQAKKESRNSVSV